MARHTAAVLGLTAVIALVLSTEGAAFAQVPASDDVVRFSRTLGQVAGTQGVRVELHKSAQESGWKLRLVDLNEGQTVGIASLPEWAGASYYGYDVTVRGLGKVVVLIFEAAPAPDVDAPPSAESFQVAWAYGVKRGEKEPVWQQIASTQNSPLDGGDRLVFRREGKKDQLLRLRSSEDTRFCGADLTAYQTFIPEQMSFRSTLDLETLSAAATRLKAALPAKPFEGTTYKRFFLWYAATSDRYNTDDSRTVIRPLELGDHDISTAWMEGDTGLGRGQFVTARINDALKVRGVRIFPGHGGSEKDYRQHATPKTVLITVADGSRYLVEIPATPWRLARDQGGVVVNFPKPVRTRCMSVVLLEAREGNRIDDPSEVWKRSAVAISEISPISELHGLPPQSAAVVVVEKLLKEEDRGQSRRLVQLTSTLGEELVTVLQDVLRTGSEEDKVRVVPLLRSLPSESSVPILVEMFVASQPSDPAYGLVKPAISSHGDLAARQLLEVLENAPPDDQRKYIDLTRMIGRLGSAETLRALIGQLGEGVDRVRLERVRSVARGGKELIPDLLAVVESGINTSAGEDALLALNSIGRKVYYRGQGTQEGSGVLLQAAGAASTRRTRLLAIKALGFFATQGAVEALSTFASESEDPLVRRQAVASLARYADREARIGLEAALFDESPDVRIAAINGLSERKDRRQALPSVQRYVERESWKPGIEQAYMILAELGDDSLLAQMQGEIARAPNGERAAVIAKAMQRAGRPISAQLVERLMFDPETELTMRRDLVDLLGVDETALGEDILVKLVRSEQPFPDLEPRPNQRLRYRAMLALGRRDSARGRDELMQIVREGQSSDIRSVALRALAFSRHEPLVPELEVLRVSAPQELKDDFENTIELVERRSDIHSVRQQVDEALSDSDDDTDPVEKAE